MKIFLYLFLIVPVITQAQFEKIPLGFSKASIVRYSPQNDVIAFATGQRVKFFRSGIQVGEIKGDGGQITGLQFDSEGESILTSRNDGWINTWNVRTKIKQNEFKIDSRIVSGDFLESPKRIVSLTEKSVLIHSLDGELIKKINNLMGSHTSMALSKSGLILATSTNLGLINLMDDQGESFKKIETGLKHIRSIALTPNGKKLAVASSSGRVDLWDVVSGTWTQTLLNARGRINSLEFSNDGEYLAAGGEIFYILSVSQKHSHVIYRKNTSATISTSFSVNGQSVCTLEDFNTYAKVYDIQDLDIPPFFKFRDEDDHQAPLVYISNPPKIINDRINYSKGVIDIEGSIFDDRGVKNLVINGYKSSIKENGRFIIHLPLKQGENPVSIQATDVNGNTSTRKFIINRRGDSEKYDHQVAKNYLFAVGIDKYQNWPNLNNAVKDANDLSSVLLDKYNFKFSEVTILKDEQASQQNIYSGLRSLIEKITPQDNLIIYFSGHGYYDELLNEGYWIPVDAKTNAQGEYLPNSSILKVLENINSQHTLLIADACFAGSLFSETSRGGNNGYIEKVDKLRSRWGLASGRLEVVSDGEVGENSPFSRVLLSFLNTNSKTEVAVSELIQNVKVRVAEQSGQTPIGSPLRLSGDEGGEFIFRQSDN